MKIAINGLGRIGRLVLRAIFDHQENIEIVAANGPADIKTHAHLLKFDSVHGIFPGEINVTEKEIHITKGQKTAKTKIFAEKNPENLPWKELGIDVVFECTGKFNNKAEASRHLTAGCRKVLVSAPCKEADSTIVLGVNHDALKNEHQIISVGSCTTNALAPIAKILNDKIGIEQGFMTTIHSYTSDQNILDGSHKDLRRARACAISMVPTSTGAAKSIGLVIPELAGKLDGSAIRVPTANVSMIDLSFTASRETNIDEINDLMKMASETNFRGILQFSDLPLVSIDFNGNAHSTIFDSLETKVIEGKFCRIISWYDNEWGFANRMIDVLKLLK